MKHLINIIFGLVFALNINAQSLSENFNGTFPPTGWTVTDANSDSYTWIKETSNSYTRGSSAGAAKYPYNASSTGNDWLITPCLYPVGGNCTFSFYASAVGGASFPEKFNIKLSTTNTSTGSFTTTLVSNVTVSSTTYSQYSYDLSAYNGQAVYIAIQCVSAENMFYLEIDDAAGPSTTASATPPTVTTTAISSIATTTATGGGNVTSAGSASVTAKGVCWNTGGSPTVSDSKTSDGTGTGSFTSSLTGLSTGVTYYVKAYATSTAGTSYGSETSFTTLALPTVTTTAISAIASTTATGGGNVTSTGGATVTEKGICWSTSTSPTIALSSKTSDGSGTGSFSSSLTGLTGGITYYVRAFATNSVGTAYGSEESFTTIIAGAPSAEGYYISGNIVNNGTIIQTDDENYLTMTGNSTGISGTTGTYTDVKLHVKATSVTFSGTMSGAFSKTYITAAKDFTVNGSKTLINGTLTNLGTLTLSASSVFKNSGNFTSTGTMSADPTSTVEFNGTAAQTVISDADQFGNVTINNTVAPGATDGVLLGDAMSLKSASTLTLNDGIAICNGYLLNVTNTAAAAIASGADNSGYTSSWVYGTSNTSCLRRALTDNTDTYTFPVGIATRANKAELINNNLPNGALTVDCWFNPSASNSQAGITSLTEGGTTYASVHASGVWTLNKTGNIDGTYDLKLYFNGGFSSLTDSKFSIVSRPTSGDNWTLVGQLSNTTVASGYAYRKNLSSFSEKGIGITDASLPVELVSFESECSNDFTVLNWSTASETNNNYFAVERSLDMLNYTELSKINGAGNYNGILNYSYTDFDIINQIKYYRIKQVDFDGGFEYFKPITSICGIGSNSVVESVNSFVNADNVIQTDILVSSSKDYTINLYNKLGQIIISKKVFANEGANSFKIESSTLASGIYLIEISCTEKSFTKKLFIQ
ncbi:MAG: choice-of-anchor J domain-containing protein [Bacteroidota bacterium]